MLFFFFFKAAQTGKIQYLKWQEEAERSLGWLSSEAQSCHDPWVGSSESLTFFSWFHSCHCSSKNCALMVKKGMNSCLSFLFCFKKMKKTCTVLQLRPITGLQPRTNSLRIIMIYTLGLRRLTFPDTWKKQPSEQSLDSLQQEESWRDVWTADW